MKFLRLSFAFFMLFFGTQTSVFAQNKKIDSLKIELQNHKINDTIKIDILYKLAFFSFQSDLVATKSYLTQVEKLSDSLNYIKGKAKVSYLRGILENRKSNYDKSFELFDKSRAYYESINDKNGIAATYIAYGINHYSLAQYDKVLENYNKATTIFKEIGNQEELVASLNRVGNLYTSLGKYDEAIDQYKQLLAQKELVNEHTVNMTYSNLGVVYRYQGKYPIAIEYYNKYLESRKKNHDTLAIASTLGNLGEIYTELDDYEKAISYLEKSLNLATKKNHKPTIAKANMGIGNVYLNKNEFQKALSYLNQALEISLEINDLETVTFCYHNIGEAYVHLNDLDVAQEFFLKAIDVNKKTGHKLGLTHNYLGISQVYIEQEDYKTGLEYALKAEKKGKDLLSLEIEKKAQYLIALAYEGLGDYKKSLKAHRQYKKLNDSLFSKQNLKKIGQLEAEYKYQRELDSASIKELKLTKQVTATNRDLEKSKQKYLWAIIGVLFVSIVLGSTIFYQKFKTIKAQNQTIVTEQKLLRSQMTPHFIFNSLSVLQGMILNKEEKKSVSYLSKFSKLMRITLENSRDKLVLLSQELLAVENYLSLQNLENETYQYSINVDKNINTELFMIPPMLIQPFVENAVEHAFNETIATKQIDVTINYSAKNLICTISDNGIGINVQKTSKATEKSSMSTLITSERLQILSKDLKVNGSITIEDRAKHNSQGTLVTLIIPHKIIQPS